MPMGLAKGLQHTSQVSSYSAFYFEVGKSNFLRRALKNVVLRFYLIQTFSPDSYTF